MMKSLRKKNVMKYVSDITTTVKIVLTDYLT